MKRKYRKRQWTRQAARKMARYYRERARTISRLRVKRYYGFSRKTETIPLVEGQSFTCQRLKVATLKLHKKERDQLRQELLHQAEIAEAYADGCIIRVRLLSSSGGWLGWGDEPNPLEWLKYGAGALRVKSE